MSSNSNLGRIDADVTFEGYNQFCTRNVHKIKYVALIVYRVSIAKPSDQRSKFHVSIIIFLVI